MRHLAFEFKIHRCIGLQNTETTEIAKELEFLNELGVQINKSSSFPSSLYLQGANSYGQLGLGHKEDVLAPQVVKEFPCNPKNIRNITGGGGHSAIVTGSINISYTLQFSVFNTDLI